MKKPARKSRRRICVLPEQNKYSRWYFLLINKAKLETRKKGNGTYYEKHHIYPRSFGGNDAVSNLVLLTAREHFVCHLLLTRMFKSKYAKIKAKRALVGMMFTRTGRRLDARRYAVAAMIQSKIMSTRNIGNTNTKGKPLTFTVWAKGKKLPPQPEWLNKKRSETLKAHWATHGHNRIGAEPWNKGKRGAQKAWNKGISPPEWHCPHCNKTGRGQANFARWHGDQCARRTI